MRFSLFCDFFCKQINNIYAPLLFKSPYMQLSCHVNRNKPYNVFDLRFLFTTSMSLFKDRAISETEQFQTGKYRIN